MHQAQAARLLIVPGLHDSGQAHWQTWLQGLHRDSLRVVQSDWHQPHISTEAGFGPLPLASRWVLAVAQRLAREWRPAAASICAWRFAT